MSDETITNIGQDETVPTTARVSVEYKRFGAFHRWMHIIVFVSFTILVFTGMPLKYKDSGWAIWVMNAMGGVTAAGIYHRIAALFTVFYWTAEMVAMSILVFKRRGRGLFNQDSILPTKKDWEDLKGMFVWFFGRGPRPQFARFTYWEKFDFLSLVAGTVIIGVTGFMMWFPIGTTRILPGIFLNIALVIHGNEALLAAGVIFIFVHLFSAHLKPGAFPIDKVIFTGSLPLEHYMEERPLEYAKRVREGTLDEVLVERRITWRTHVTNAIWYTITVIAGLAAVAMTVFMVWSVVSWFAGRG
jgi:cytochrome b subunit of formate dehydrogenase